MGKILILAGEIFKSWLDGRREIKKAKEQAKIKNLTEGIPGYNDNYLVFVWSYPIVASFVPILRPSVIEGFEFLNTLPDWYVAGFMAITGAVFGLDKIFRFKK